MPFINNVMEILKLKGVAHLEFDYSALTHLGGLRTIPYQCMVVDAHTAGETITDRSVKGKKATTRLYASFLPDELDDAIERMYKVIEFITNGSMVKAKTYARKGAKSEWGTTRLHLQK